MYHVVAVTIISDTTNITPESCQSQAFYLTSLYTQIAE